MKDEIYIEKGNRIQFCQVVRVIRRSDVETAYYDIQNVEDIRVINSNQFDKWYWKLTPKMIDKVITEREKLLNELTQLDLIEKFINNDTQK